MATSRYRGLAIAAVFAINLAMAIAAYAEPITRSSSQLQSESNSQPNAQLPRLQTARPATIRLEVNLTTKQVTVYQGTKNLKQYPIAIGRAGWETPQGVFKVNQVVRDPVWMNPLTGTIVPSGDPKNPLGRHWIGFLR
jgi:lipoprotein-anchoring transpeptidase ErfK/SrfK